MQLRVSVVEMQMSCFRNGCWNEPTELPAVPILILLKLLLEHARKQFRFYYAKTCFEIIIEKKSESDKAEYLNLGLEWYNKFVKRVTKNTIDTGTIYTKIISHSQLSNNVLLDTITESFDDGDEFKPLRHMVNLLACWKEGDILVKESLKTKIKESSDLLIPVVTVTITIITTFFLKAPTQWIDCCCPLHEPLRCGCAFFVHNLHNRTLRDLLDPRADNIHNNLSRHCNCDIEFWTLLDNHFVLTIVQYV